MAIPATAHIEVHQPGSDTLNGGFFDPGQSAGMLTDGAATVANTASPVFTSASYTFAANDANHYIYIHAGTNWVPGWYKIASVAAGAATLSAAVGAAQLKQEGLNTTAGCASVASPTGATWAIDYSQADAARFAYTDLRAVGASFDLTSAGNPFWKAYVGNSLVVTGGTGFVAGRYYITAVNDATHTATFGPGQPHTGLGTDSDGTGGLGGALATPGMAGSIVVAGNRIWLKYNATPYTSASDTSNVATGRLTLPTSLVTTQTFFMGYETVRGDRTSNRPTYQRGINGTTNYFVTMGAFCAVRNMILDGQTASYTGRGISMAGNTLLSNVKLMNMRTFPVGAGGANNTFQYCEITGNADSISLATTGGNDFNGCYIHDNTAAAVTVSSGSIYAVDTIFDTNGAAGISTTSTCRLVCRNCDFYGNTGAGVDFTAQPNFAHFTNCSFELNNPNGIKCAAAYDGIHTHYCSFYVDGVTQTAKYSGITGALPYGHLSGFNVVSEFLPTSSVYVNAASGNFQKNTAAGYVVSQTGYPQTFPGLTFNNYPSVGAFTPQGQGGTPFGAAFI